MEPAPGAVPLAKQFDNELSTLVGTFQSLKESHSGSTYNSGTGRFTHLNKAAGRGQINAPPLNPKQTEKLAQAESKAFLADINTVKNRLFPLVTSLQNPVNLKNLDVKEVALLNSRVAQLKKAIEEAEKNLDVLPREFPGQEEKVKAPIKDFITYAKSQVEMTQKFISTSTRIKVQGVLDDLHLYGPKEGDHPELVQRRNEYQEKSQKVRDMQALHKTRMDLRSNALEICNVDIKFFNEISKAILEKNKERAGTIMMSRTKPLILQQKQREDMIANLEREIKTVKDEIKNEEARLSPAIVELGKKLAKLELLLEPLRDLDLRIENAKVRGDKSDLKKLEADKDKPRLDAVKQGMLEIKQKIDVETARITSPTLTRLEERRVALDKTLAQEKDAQSRLLSRIGADEKLSYFITNGDFNRAKALVQENVQIASEARDIHKAAFDTAKEAFEYYTQLVALTNNIGNNLENWLRINSGQNINALDYGTVLNLLRARDFFMNPVKEL